MKKTVLIFAVFGALLAACNSTQNTEKIDFTKSYENAALALADAQNNFDIAIASHDTTRIAAAKVVLENATAKYVSSKKTLVANGGTAKPQYEQYLQSSTQVLSQPAGKETGTSIDTILTNAANKKIQTAEQAILDKHGQAIGNISKTVNDGKSKVNAITENAKQNVQKVGDNLNKKQEDSKKKLDDKVNKAKSDLQKLLQ